MWLKWLLLFGFEMGLIVSQKSKPPTSQAEAARSTSQTGPKRITIESKLAPTALNLDLCGSDPTPYNTQVAPQSKQPVSSVENYEKPPISVSFFASCSLFCMAFVFSLYAKYV